MHKTSIGRRLWLHFWNSDTNNVNFKLFRQSMGDQKKTNFLKTLGKLLIVVRSVNKSFRSKTYNSTDLGGAVLTGVGGSKWTLGLQELISKSSSTSNASVSIEDLCWCCKINIWRLFEDGVNNEIESACKTVAWDSFQFPSLWSLVTSLVKESLEANGEDDIPVTRRVCGR